MPRHPKQDYEGFVQSRELDDVATAQLTELFKQTQGLTDPHAKRSAEFTLLHELWNYGVNEFTTTDGQRVKFMLRATPMKGKEADLARWLVAEGHKVDIQSPNALEKWAKKRLREGLAIPDDLIKVWWPMSVKPQDAA